MNTSSDSITASVRKPVIPSHGACRFSLPCCSRSPSDGLPGGKPSPRKSSEVRATIDPDSTNGMKVTIQSVNAKGDTTRWWYTTTFDGSDMPVTGNAGQSHAAVKTVSPYVNEIVNKKDGRVTQRLTNVLSPDHNTIAVIYMREDAQGKTTGVTFATYVRMP